MCVKRPVKVCKYTGFNDRLMDATESLREEIGRE